ncbi:DUF4837 family protein, partial [Candidatus Fermentibacterales bacterium]|nr:DUF4837 family protein [Candidatus Fermentibacterales bacterium]
TILVVAGDADGIPDGLSAAEGVRGGFLHYGYDVWARGQSVYALTADDLLAGGSDLGALSDSLERAYDRHMSGYVYGSFVNTQMSSPARIDSLSDLGFTLDVPKSYATKEWLPDDGFVQFQRELSSESLLLMLSVRWVEEARVEGVSGPDEALLWREEMARRFFFDAALDSVDRARTTVVPMRLRGLDGYLLVGAWRNPEHLNAGAFTSYVLRDRETGTGYMLDFEVYHPHATKEIYLREGWTILNTFFPGGSDG